MKYRKLYILALLALICVGCSKDREEPDTVSDDTPIEIAARTSWQCGRTMGVTRAPIVDPVGTSGAVPVESYPQLVHVTVTGSVGEPGKFIIAHTPIENDNYGYEAYHDQYQLSNITFDASGRHAVITSGTKESRPLYTRNDLLDKTVEANTLSPRFNGDGDGNIPQAWDDTDIKTVGVIDHLTTKSAFGGNAETHGNHLFLTLGHVTAMLRLHFAVAEKYDKIRYIDLKSVSINDQATLVLGAEAPNETSGHLILPLAADGNNSAHARFSYAYVKPSHYHNGTVIPATWTNPVSASTPLTFRCTYDVYDKDAKTIEGFVQGEIPTADALTEAASHRTRTAEVSNTVRLSNLKDPGGNAISIVKSGYYYDLYITINPDYLYVLSDHDNKQMTIQ